MYTPIVLLMAVVAAAGCEDTAVETPKRWTDGAVSSAARVMPRWYTAEQVAAGAALFQAHCAECHGKHAEGTAGWRRLDAEGKHPPPPLNGTAHTWRHPLFSLRRAVSGGGALVGGSMPGFAEKLNAEENDAILAWVQSHWSDEIYAKWSELNVQAGQP